MLSHSGSPLVDYEESKVTHWSTELEDGSEVVPQGTALWLGPFVMIGLYCTIGILSLVIIDIN
jgi:hypothetical protein